MFLKDVSVMHVVDLQKPPVGARVSDPGRLSSGKKTSVSVSFCFCGLKESSWSVSLDYRKELIAKKHHPPPHYFSSNLFIIQREPIGFLLCSRDREVFTPLCKEGGGEEVGASNA